MSASKTKTSSRAPYSLSSKVLVYQGASAWRFLVIPKDVATKIKETHGKHARGWGSLPVTVTVGITTWQTSLFPDSKSGTYLLPLKAKVRKAEHILDEDTVSFSFSLRS